MGQRLAHGSTRSELLHLQQQWEERKIKTHKKTRRKFLQASGTVLGAACLAINSPLLLAAARAAQEKMQSGGGYENISSQEAMELGAIADQIIPADETPGAIDTGVVYFIDAVLGGFMAQAGPQLRQGLEDLHQRTITSHPKIEHYSDLSFAQQTDILRQVENTPFFATVYFLTISGMFCLPSYGGNRGNAGWDLLGFDHRHVWQAPFGYYDAAVLEAGGKHDHT